MGAALDDSAPVDDQELVGLAHRGQPMGDHQRRPTAQGLAQGALHRRF